MDIINFLWILPLSYVVIYFLLNILRNKFSNFIDEDNPFICSVCGAYFIVLIIAFIDQFPPLITAMMLGMSISGIANASNTYLKKKKDIDFSWQYFALQIFFTTIGLLILIFYLNQI